MSHANSTDATEVVRDDSEITGRLRLKLDYPKTRREDIWDNGGGVVFEDPYRWLEETNPEVLAWDELENEFTQQHVRKMAALQQAGRAHQQFARRGG